MTKNYKTTRQDLSKKYHEKLRKVDETLEFLAESWYSKEEIKETRERLISNLQVKLDNEEWYKQAKKEHKNEIKERWPFIETIKWNTEAIIQDLRKTRVKVDKNVEMLWKKWDNIHINIPPIWKFEWLKFDCFISYKKITREEYESDSKYEKASYSTKEIATILHSINKYMIELEWINDWNMDYENKLKERQTSSTCYCKAWECLKLILNGNLEQYGTWFYLKDKDVEWIKGSRAQIGCWGADDCFFFLLSGNPWIDPWNNLLLKLSN